MSDRYTWTDRREDPRQAESEREQGHKETPLTLTEHQRDRLWIILRDEVGPAAAIRCIKAIDAQA
jgi:hypothetical protein